MHSQLPRFLLYFFILYQCIFLRSGTDYADQIDTPGSVLAKALNRDPEISPTPPLIFTGVKMCEIWPHSQRRSTLRRRRLKMEQDISTLKQTR